MQRIFLGLFALLMVAACGTPKTAANGKSSYTDKPAMADFRAQPPSPGPAPTIDLGDFQDFKLDNDLQVILVENHKLPRVSYQLFVDVPPQLEGPYAGASGMLGSMLRRATSTKSKQEIDEAIDFIGASLNTSGSGASGFTISKYKETLLEMLAEVVLDARFPAEEFDKVKSETEAGLKSQLSSPGAIANRVMSVVNYGPGHPYGELMTEETLANITVDQIKAYYDTYFAPNKSYLVMVGDLTRAEAESLAKKHFGDWKSKTVPDPTFNQPDRPTGVTVNFVPRSGAVQSTILIGHPVDVKPGTERALEASIANDILGSGFGGRLFQNLREDKGYTYGANSSVRPDEEIGSFVANADVRNEVTDSAITEFMKELRLIATEEVSAEELARTKAQITGSFGRALESPNRIASYALNTIRYNLDRDYYPTYLQKVAKVDAEDLLATAQRIITPSQTNIVVVGDKSIASKLARFATSGEINYYDVNGRPLSAAAVTEMSAPADVSPAQVVNKYLTAIGGQTAVANVKSMSLVMEGEVQGQKMSQTMYKEGNERFSSQMTMMGMVMADQRYNGGKAQVKMQGQTVPPNPMVDAAMKEEALLFPVLALSEKGKEVKVTGTETVDGKPAIVLEATGATGPVQYYFDRESGLLVQKIASQGPQRVTTKYSDYRALDGVMIPYTTSLVGLAPFPIELKVTEAKVNAAIDQELFKIE